MIAERLEALIPKAEFLRNGFVSVMVGQPAEKVVPFRQYFPDWHEGVWETGENLMYGGHAYTVIAPGHDSTGNPDWTPATQNALFKLWHGVSKETALPWKKPTGSHDMYKKGEYMVYEDELTYKALMDTTYTPIEYPQAWEVQVA